MTDIAKTQATDGAPTYLARGDPADRQDFNFAGPWGDNGFIEDYMPSTSSPARLERT